MTRLEEFTVVAIWIIGFCSGILGVLCVRRLVALWRSEVCFDHCPFCGRKGTR